MGRHWTACRKLSINRGRRRSSELLKTCLRPNSHLLSIFPGNRPAYLNLSTLKVLDGCLDVTYISNHMTKKSSQQWTDYIYGPIIYESSTLIYSRFANFLRRTSRFTQQSYNAVIFHITCQVQRRLTICILETHIGTVH